MAFWNKLNANEKLVAYGAALVLVAWIIGIVTGGGFGASWSFIAAIAVLVIYYLKYSPTSNITWPAPVQTIVLIIAGLAAVFAILGLLTLLSVLGFFAGFLIGFLIAIVLNAIGAVMMALGAWREYQAMPKAAPPAPPAPPAV
jgi:hypothetical protein